MILVGLTEGLADAMERVRLKWSRDWAAALLLVISIPYSAYSVMNGRAEAQRQTHADFDAACQWIARHVTRTGPILTRHPGEVFWQTGHPTIEPDSSSPAAINELIDRLGASYLLIDEERYVNAESNPLQEYIKQYPDRVVFIWGSGHDHMVVRIFKVIGSN